jgi:hypothetical protein
VFPKAAGALHTGITLKKRAKVIHIFELTKFFGKKMQNNAKKRKNKH